MLILPDVKKDEDVLAAMKAFATMMHGKVTMMMLMLKVLWSKSLRKLLNVFAISSMKFSRCLTKASAKATQ